MTTLSISLLGPFQARLGDQPLGRFRGSRVQALLIYLAENRSAPVSREGLMALFWPEILPRSAQTNLRQTLYQLRKLIPECASKQSEESVPFLIADRATIHINPAADLTLDTQLFNWSADQTLSELSAAARLYRGDFLQDFYVADCAPFEEWARAQREYYRRQKLSLLEAMGQRYLDAGDWPQLEETAHRQLEIEPLHSPGHRLLIEAVARDGRRRAALSHYETYRRLLADELGLKPARATLELHSRLISGRFETTPTRTLGDYELGELLGQNSLATVYRARQKSLSRAVAIKIIHPKVANDPIFAGRFAREAKLIAQMEHPYIVPLYEFWQDESGAYLVMRLMTGGTLAGRLARNGPIPLGQIHDFMNQIGGALASVHATGIVHRDVKPENILLDEHGFAYLGDFGIAREAGGAGQANGLAVGTPAYLAPEQIVGAEPSPQSDIYSLGILLYELLTGNHPFAGETAAELLPAQLESPVPALGERFTGLPAALDLVIQKATAKERSERYANVDAFLAELSGAIATANTAEIKTVTGGQSPHNLPPQPRDFVGRERALAELKELLTVKTGQLITVIGPGGIGKTRLSIALGQQLLATNHFPDGIFLVQLAPLTDPARLASRIVEDVGLQLEDEAEQKLAEQLLNYLRQKRMLLILDNYEHLLPQTELLTQLRRQVPTVSILVTSRERIQLRDEQLYPIEGLAIAGPTQAAVQLFRQSARRSDPTFDLTNETESQQVEMICRSVDGLPLAIELAAGWVDMLPLSEIAAEIKAGLDILQTELRDIPMRHRSIRATITHSWQKLSSTEQALFAKLSIFQGGFTREAAQAIAGASLRDLSRLRSKSMISFSQKLDRFTIHGLLQQFGREMLATDLDGEREIYRRHCAYFSQYCFIQGEKLKGSDPLRTLTEIHAELDNCRAAWQWAIAEGEWTELLKGHYVWYDVLGNWLALNQELAALLDQVAAAAEMRESPAAKKLLFVVLALRGYLSTRGDLDAFWNQPEPVSQGAQKAIALLHTKPLADSTEWPGRFFAQTLLSGQVSDLDEGIALCRVSVDAFQQAQDSFHTAHSLWYLSNLLDLKGEGEARRRCLEASLQTTEEIGDNALVIAIKIQLAWLAQDQNRLGDAFQLATETQELARTLNRPHHIAACHRLLGWNHLISGRFEAAHATYEESVRYYENYGYESSLATAHYDLGHTAFHLGDYGQVKTWMEDVVTRATRIGDDFVAAIARGILGNVLLLLGDPEGAMRLHEESLTVLRAMGSSLWWIPQFFTYQLVGLVHNGRSAEAEALNLESLGLTAADPRWHTAIVLAGTALVLATQGKHERALEVFAAACSHPHVGNSRWFKDAVGAYIAELAQELPAAAQTAAAQRGHQSDITHLNLLANMLRTELSNG